MRTKPLTDKYRKQNLLTESEAAEYLRLTDRKLHALFKEGHLPRHPLKGTKRFGYRIKDLDFLFD
jgi:excisionase family DNA binding protein